MIMRVTYMGDIQDINNTPLTLDEIMHKVFFGVDFKIPERYDENKIYNAGDPVVYVDPDGTMNIYYAKHSGITGPFNKDDWGLYAIYSNYPKDQINLNNLNVYRLINA